jgi:hypothetical protein
VAFFRLIEVEYDWNMIGICIICIICVLVAESSLVSESFLIRYGESDFFCFGILFLIQARNPCDFPRRSKVRPIRRASWNEQLSKACYIMLYHVISVISVMRMEVL